MKTLYEKEVEIRRDIHERLNGSMNSRDNVLYFPNNIDIRICPKNGITTLKWALWYTMNLPFEDNRRMAARCGTKKHRVEEIKKHGFYKEYPYRENSQRITVVRDPIERFLSACEYLRSQWDKNTELLEADDVDDAEKHRKWLKMSQIDRMPDTLDEAIEAVYYGEIANTHFYTQAYFLGNIGQYDARYKFSQFHKFMVWLQRACRSPNALDNVHLNKSTTSFYGSVNDLTQDQIDRIMKIVGEDYEYGWTEKNAITL